VGNAGGGWPGSFEDVANGFRFLSQIAKQYKLDVARVLVMGHSAGGQLALCLAAHEPALTRAVSLAGVVDLQRAFELHLSNDAVVEFLGGKPADVAEHYQEADPMQVSIRKARQILICGTKDDVVPPSFSEKYAEAKHAKGEDVKLIEIADADHFDVIDPRSDAWKRVEGAVSDLLG
jgi:dipeptidyl aminopeptidase/acylaminoacyl peptidase